MQCKLCGKETSNEYCHECYWKAKWPEHILNSPELERRRKRSHLTKLLSLDRDKPEAIFKASSSRNGTTYTTTLQSCTCHDFAITHGAMPCKHILRLAGELGLFKSEHFLSGERDYTIRASDRGKLGQESQHDFSPDFIWRTRWDSEILASVELASRRKSSHTVKIISFDNDKLEAVCADSDTDTEKYITTLTGCSCDDFSSGFGIRPCKHIFRLAGELNLFQCEHDMTKDYGEDLRSVFISLDDSKEARKKKRMICMAWTETLYGFDTTQEGVDFINSLKLTVPQIKEAFLSRSSGLSGRKKAEIIERIADSTSGHSHRQLLRWLIDQIYKRGTIEECEEFLTSLNLTTQQIMEVAEFRNFHVSGSNEQELIKSLVAETVGKTARYTGNVVNVVTFHFDATALNEEKISSTIESSTEIENQALTESALPEQEQLAGEILAIDDTVSKEIHPDNRPSGFFKFLKFIVCCPMLFIALAFLLGSLSDAKNNKLWLCVYSAFFIAGCLVMNTARRKNLQGSGFSYFLYGALIPVVSWIDVTMANSQSKAKSFMKGLVISIIGILAFLAVFVNFLPPVKAKEPAKIPAPEIKAENLAPAKISEDKAVPAPVIPDIKQESEQEAEAEEDTDEEAEERERQAEIKKQEQEYLREANAVVITPRGKKYHYKDCRTVRGKYTRLTIVQALKKGYKPCGVCTPPAKPVTEAPNLDFETY